MNRFPQDETDRIEKIAQRIVAESSGCQECIVAQRLERVEVEVETIKGRLSTGDIGFAEVRKDIKAIAEKVDSLITGAWWLIGLIIIGVLGTVGSVVIFVLTHMGTMKP